MGSFVVADGQLATVCALTETAVNAAKAKTIGEMFFLVVGISPAVSKMSHCRHPDAALLLKTGRGSRSLGDDKERFHYP